MRIKDRLLGAGAVLMCVCAAVGSASFFESRSKAGEALPVSANIFTEDTPVIVLDAGHGGST